MLHQQSWHKIREATLVEAPFHLLKINAHHSRQSLQRWTRLGKEKAAGTAPAAFVDSWLPTQDNLRNFSFDANDRNAQFTND
jgi:hypothetical protein